MSNICATCLSTNRRLTPLKSVRLRHILNCIFWLDIELNMEWDRMCWECSAMVKRIQRFQQQAARAHHMLTLYRSTAQPSQHLEGLSKLSACTKITYDDSILYEETVKNETEDNSYYECRAEVKIKIENDLDSEENTNQKENGTSSLNISKELVKEESIIVINKVTGSDSYKIETRKITKQMKERKKSKKHAKETKISKKQITNSDEEEEFESRREDLTNTAKEAENIFRVDIEDIDYSSSEEELERRQSLNKSEETGDSFKHLNKDRFIVRKMSMEELLKAREMDSNCSRYKLCPFKCETCIKGYYSQDRYNAHVNKFHSENLGSFVCTMCSRRFSTEDYLQNHYEAHLNRYVCRVCEFSHHRVQAMIIHTNSKHELTTVECNICHKRFFTSSKLRYHKAREHGEQITCNVCNKHFTTPSNLKKHQRSHDKPELLREECPQCGGMYRQLRVHIARTHAPARAGGEDAYCAECNRQYRNVYIYRNHLKQHSRHRQPEALKHACPHCDARFMMRCEVKRHVTAIHTKQHPLKCDTCGKGFYSKNVLRKHHQEKHEGIPRPRNKVCTYCGKAFKDKVVLNNHVRTHTGEKPYACAQCPWRFAQRTALKTHERALHPKPDAPSTSAEIKGHENASGDISSV